MSRQYETINGTIIAVGPYTQSSLQAPAIYSHVRFKKDDGTIFQTDQVHVPNKLDNEIETGVEGVFLFIKNGYVRNFVGYASPENFSIDAGSTYDDKRKLIVFGFWFFLILTIMMASLGTIGLVFGAFPALVTVIMFLNMVSGPKGTEIKQKLEEARSQVYGEQTTSSTRKNDTTKKSIDDVGFYQELENGIAIKKSDHRWYVEDKDGNPHPQIQESFSTLGKAKNALRSL